MIYTLAVILLVVWLLSWISDFTVGGFVHLLLVAALVLIVAQLVHGRKHQQKHLKP